MPWSPLPSPGGPPPKPLTEGLDRVLAGLGSPTVDAITTIRDCWADLVGPEAAEALRPMAVEDGKLITATSSTAWASQVRWLEAGVVARAGEILGPGVITGMVTRMRPAN